MYLDPGSDPSYEDLYVLISQLDPPFVVVGDLNAHSMLWNSTRTNSKGLLVERLLEDHDISLLNDDQPTYFSVQNNSTSVIDLGICSSNIFTDFTWDPSDNLHGSDHFPIILKCSEPSRTPSIPRWNLKKADWSLYKLESGKIGHISAIVDHLEAYDALVDVITVAANKSIPKTKPSKGKPPVPWWDKTCHNLRKVALKCYDRYRANPSDTNKAVYNRALAKRKRYFKQAKRKSWQDYVSTIDTDTPIASVWNKIRKLSGKYVPKPLPSLVVDGCLISNSDRVADTLAAHFSSVSSSTNYANDFRERARVTPAPDFTSGNTEYYNEAFSDRELRFALSKTANNSPGEDMINAELISRLPPETPLMRGAFPPWGGLRGAVTAWAMPVGLVPGGSYRAGLAIREHPD